MNSNSELNMNFFLCVWQRENKCHPGWFVRPNPQNFHQNTEPHTLYLHWFLLHLSRLWFQLRIKEPFPYRSIWEMVVQKTGATLPGLLWFGIKWHAYGFQPPHGLFREIYAPCCGFIQDMCVCAMRKVQWAHAGNMQAFVGIFLFFPGSPFDFSGILSFVESLCIPEEIMSATHCI